MLDISSKYTDIEVVGTFKDKFNVLWGESGSGKTFLFSKIKSYLQDAVVVYVEICKCIDYGLYYFSGGFKELTVDCTM